MGSTRAFAEYVTDQLQQIGGLRVHKMFGEYAIYLEEKVIGFICDDQLFYKVSDQGLQVLAEAGVEAEYGTPYPKARDHLLVTFLENADLVSQLALATADALPPPRSKRSRRAVDAAN